MTDDQKKLAELESRLHNLMRKHAAFGREIKTIQEAIQQLSERSEPMGKSVDLSIRDPQTHESSERLRKIGSEKVQSKIHNWITGRSLGIDLEKFIGENLINKIGIIITIIGVGIGARYAIDNNLISPLTRIILGYLTGAGLLGFAIRLKGNYESFSAVLLSGAMAIFYFITYAAFSFYSLIPLIPTFISLVVFTAFTVVAAIQYRRQVIAVLGMVGAYAVPFLLGGDPGEAATLFTYMIILNTGIVFVSFLFYWKLLYHAAFVISWSVYFQWMYSEYRFSDDFVLAFLVSTAFFVIFYITALAHKIRKGVQFKIRDIFLLLLNSFFFYGIGYALLSDHPQGKELLGLFTLGNAAIHFVVSLGIYYKRLVDRNLFYFITGLVLVFVTIAIPVQLDGNWVTLLWIAEATLLFWIGRSKGLPVYEKLSYPVIAIAFVSLAQYWSGAYEQYRPEFPDTRITPLVNIHFLTSLLAAVGFGLMTYLIRNNSFPEPEGRRQWMPKAMSFLVPALFLIILFASFSVEITSYWDQRYWDSAISAAVREGEPERRFWNYDLKRMGTIWNVNFALLFLTVLSVVNVRKIKNRVLGYANVTLNILIIALFLLVGLMTLSELRGSYLEQTLSEFYQRDTINLWIHYISFILAGGLLWVCHLYVKSDLLKGWLSLLFDLLLHISILTMASFELVHWMDIAGSTQSDKLGLSILWGLYSLVLIILGIWKSKQHLRIGAIGLFALTLVKLFFYDITHLNTIARTIVFISLGILLLIISFLYNKYKKVIFGEREA